VQREQTSTPFLQLAVACGGSLGAVLAVLDACGGVAKVAKAARHGLAVDASGEGRQVSLAGLEALGEALGGSATQVDQVNLTIFLKYKSQKRKNPFPK